MKLVCALIALVFVGTAFAQKPPTGDSKAGHAPSQQVSVDKLKKLEATYKTTKAAFAKKPKDAKVKKSYLDATFAVGMGTMYGDGLSPRQKYAGALAYFREVLKVEPKHKGAKENYDMIAKIYRDMGRPVPGETPPGK